jgi:hypothetical protein
VDPLQTLVSVVLTAAIVIPVAIAAVFARQLLRISRSRRASARSLPGARRAADRKRDTDTNTDTDTDTDTDTNTDTDTDTDTDTNTDTDTDTDTMTDADADADDTTDTDDRAEDEHPEG